MKGNNYILMWAAREGFSFILLLSSRLYPQFANHTTLSPIFLINQVTQVCYPFQQSSSHHHCQLLMHKYRSDSHAHIGSTS